MTKQITFDKATKKSVTRIVVMRSSGKEEAFAVKGDFMVSFSDGTMTIAIDEAMN